MKLCDAIHVNLIDNIKIKKIEHIIKVIDKFKLSFLWLKVKPLHSLHFVSITTQEFYSSFNEHFNLFESRIITSPTFLIFVTDISIWIWSNQLIFKNKSPSLPNLFITYKHQIKPNYKWNRAAISYYINKKDMMLIYLEDTMCIFLFHYREILLWQFHKFLHIMFVHVLYGFHTRNIHMFPPIINVAPKPLINSYGFHVASKIDNAFLFWVNWTKSSSIKISTLSFI